MCHPPWVYLMKEPNTLFDVIVVFDVNQRSAVARNPELGHFYAVVNFHKKAATYLVAVTEYVGLICSIVDGAGYFWVFIFLAGVHTVAFVNQFSWN